MMKQRTVARSETKSGIALHTGARATMRLLPADENSGIVFRRIDLPGKPEVCAKAENVVDVQRGTSIGNGKAIVYTVEHIMSALHAAGIDNCLVEMDGPEPPIFDGSSLEFWNLIKNAGAVEQQAEVKFFTPESPIMVEGSVTRTVYFPADEGLRITCVTSFKGCPVDPQFFEYTLDNNTYPNEISPARTFVDYRDLKMLIGMGLCKGGSLDVAAIIHDGAILCKDAIRFHDEIVRHKILDLIGDLYLTGKRLAGRIITVKPGHPTNVELAKKLLAMPLREIK